MTHEQLYKWCYNTVLHSWCKHCYCLNHTHYPSSFVHHVMQRNFKTKSGGKGEFQGLCAAQQDVSRSILLESCHWSNWPGLPRDWWEYGYASTQWALAIQVGTTDPHYTGDSWTFCWARYSSYGDSPAFPHGDRVTDSPISGPRY